MKQSWDREQLNVMYHKQGKTLQEIGDLYGVTRERIRQVMASYNIPRVQRGARVSKFGHARYGRRFASLEEYIEGTYNPYNHTLRKYLDLELLHCAECSSRRNIHLHHISYPAKSLEDIQFLCASCHQLKHKQGMTLTRQIDLFNDYKRGMKHKDMASGYNISMPYVAKIIRKLKSGWHTTRG